MSLTAYILALITAAIISVIIKLVCNPQKRAYKVKWNESVGTIEADIDYGKNEGNEFDLYLPADKSRKDYGLVAALEKCKVPHDYIEFPHSGHGLQNDNKYYVRYLDKLDEYLARYLPVN